MRKRKGRSRFPWYLRKSFTLAAILFDRSYITTRDWLASPASKSLISSGAKTSQQGKSTNTDTKYGSMLLNASFVSNSEREKYSFQKLTVGLLGHSAAQRRWEYAYMLFAYCSLYGHLYLIVPFYIYARFKPFKIAGWIWSIITAASTVCLNLRRRKFRPLVIANI